jgi:hypothetical protein
VDGIADEVGFGEAGFKRGGFGMRTAHHAPPLRLAIANPDSRTRASRLKTLLRGLMP